MILYNVLVAVLGLPPRFLHSVYSSFHGIMHLLGLQSILSYYFKCNFLVLGNKLGVEKVTFPCIGYQVVLRENLLTMEILKSSSGTLPTPWSQGRSQLGSWSSPAFGLKPSVSQGRNNFPSDPQACPFRGQFWQSTIRTTAIKGQGLVGKSIIWRSH